MRVLRRWGVNCSEPLSFGAQTDAIDFRVMNGDEPDNLGPSSRRDYQQYRDLLLLWRRGITVVMKNRKNNVLPFPKPPEEEPGISTIIAQVGSDRFAIHIQVEDLPPAPPPVMMVKRRAKKGSSRDCEAV